ncbi:MAG: hypothetical protein SGPRY_010891, partial [Prymnesium sp.]
MSEYEKYRRQRGESSFEEAERGYRSFAGIDQEFDGGDSGGGVVGDGNTDLEDQHNSPTLGALRSGIADVTSAGHSVGRGTVVKGDTEARTAAAGKNYFGRSTGIADKIIENMNEEDVKMGRIDAVRAQQKENWFNQRAIHRANRAAGQGVVFGETTEGRPSEGGYVARDALDSAAWRSGVQELEISQRDLAKHLENLAAMPAERLDGQEWGELVITSADPITETYEVRVSPRQTSVTSIIVRNDYNTFAPYRCGLVSGSSSVFSVSPRHGTMNRRSGEPIEVVVRYTPQSPGEVHEAILVFETEDMKKIYKFI